MSLTHHFVTNSPSSPIDEKRADSSEEVTSQAEALVPEFEQDSTNIDDCTLEQEMVPEFESAEPVFDDLGVDLNDSHHEADQAGSPSINIESVDDEHPSGRPKRQVVRRGRPLDQDFLYFD